MNELPPRYYLDNFQFFIRWVEERYVDLLDKQELAFVESFRQLNKNSQCLLVRMIGRKGPWFRADKLSYAEIADCSLAADQLINMQLISINSSLDISELASVLTKAELLVLFEEQLRGGKTERKEALIEILKVAFPDSQTWQEWTSNRYGRLYRLEIQAIISRLLLLFFGNPYQNLSEFVLQDLCLFRYEQYTIDRQHRLFKNREEIIQYQQLLALRDQLDTAQGLDALAQLAEQLPAKFANPTMERRRARLLNQVAYEFERYGEFDRAIGLYRQTDLPPSRERQIRLLEKSGNYLPAWQLLSSVKNTAASEHELQIIARMEPRLARKLGLTLAKKQSHPVIEKYLTLPRLTASEGDYFCVEELVRLHLHSPDAPCFYVENELLNGLFGLWLWPEMFRGSDGAFTNPFQAAPLDLYQDDFQANRPGLAALWQLLEEQVHDDHIKTLWQEKNGIANHFVNWQFIDEEILQLALDCITPAHLKLIFQRLLFDLKANRSGFPDLIQFFPASKTYLMIEVKGPGDRIQDNQQRWLDFFNSQQIPAEVCYVSWQE